MNRANHDTPRHVRCIQILIDFHADVDAVDDAGMTALACAAFENNKQVVKCLLAAGANPSIADSYGRIPYQKTRDQGHAETAEMLLEAAQTWGKKTWPEDTTQLFMRYNWAKFKISATEARREVVAALEAKAAAGTGLA